MAPDMTAYKAVTRELRRAEDEAVLRRLAAGSEGRPSEEARKHALRWVHEFQMCRVFMNLMLRDLADATVVDGEVRLQAARDLPPEVIKLILNSPGARGSIEP